LLYRFYAADLTFNFHWVCVVNRETSLRINFRVIHY